MKTVLVTSAVPGEGKTTVAMGLARAAALSGSHVILVEADLRRPSFAQRLRVDNKVGGLATALFDEEDPLELLQSPFSELQQLQVLPAGQVPPDAAGRLHPYDLTRVFETLASHADLVVIDSAPLLPVVDTRVLLNEVGLDAHLIVARVGVTKREDIRSVRALLDQQQLKKRVGLVINALPAGMRSYYYGEDPTGPERRGRDAKVGAELNS